MEAAVVKENKQTSFSILEEYPTEQLYPQGVAIGYTN